MPQPVRQTVRSDGYPAYVGNKHHSALLRLIHLTHEPTFLPPDLSNFPDPGVMSTCIGLYFEHFHPILPVLRPAAFEDIDMYLRQQHQPDTSEGDRDATDSSRGKRGGMPARNILEYQSHPYYPFLLLTMCAIGATYAKQDWKSVAIYMNELARRAGKHLVCRMALRLRKKQELTTCLHPSTARQRFSGGLFEAVHASSSATGGCWFGDWISRSIPRVGNDERYSCRSSS